ncbi:hypothetical protein CDAR_384521 [Caerostris darwini]|uniref:Uncharacterized protein n=1 Tax=Caerostris darwini TaxID=1538125 RepID=A0AAV4SPV8_9ARAC|nr:hypothetical protein CDAR_384521 [Caerostris darwini]
MPGGGSCLVEVAPQKSPAHMNGGDFRWNKFCDKWREKQRLKKKKPCEHYSAPPAPAVTLNGRSWRLIWRMKGNLAGSPSAGEKSVGPPEAKGMSLPEACFVDHRASDPP